MNQENYYQAFKNTCQFEMQVIPGPDQQHSLLLPSYYKPFRFLGSGAFGVVFAAIDTRIQNAANDRDKAVAIKKIPLKGAHRTSLKRYLREMKILRLLENRSIIKLKSIVLPPSREEFTDLYLVFEILDCDLHEVIRKQSLTLFHIQYFTTKILQGMHYLHSCGILHRDLKPKNVLITKNNDLKISDFGLARVVIDHGDPTLTDYVVTRWYRAPELLLGFTDYSEAVDIWSIGCIIAEMILGKPIFPGKSNSIDSQFKLIIDFTGFKAEEVECFGPETQEYLMKKFQTEIPPNVGFLYEKCPVGADLVIRMLKLNPSERISLKEALTHPFITEKCKPKFNLAKEPVNKLEFEFEDYEVHTSKEQYMDMLYEQILLHHFPSYKQEYLNRVSHNMSIIQHILSRGNEEDIENEMDEEFEG